MAIHYVGMKTTGQYAAAVAVWGQPTMIHKYWDARAVADVVPGDVVIYASGDDQQIPSKYSYDDSAHF